MSLSVHEQRMFNYFKVSGVLNEEDMEVLLEELQVLAERDMIDPPTNLQDLMASTNRVIKKYDLEITEATDEVSGSKIYCIISTGSATMAQKASFYSKQACELLSNIIRECVLSNCGYVSETSFLNQKTNSKSNKASTEALLRTLIHDKWVVREDGKISLGMRCLLELEMTIKEQYPDHVKHCGLCQQFMMQGFTCNECESRVHFYCVDKYYRINKLPASSKICPICNKDTESKDGVKERSSVNSVREAPTTKKRKSEKVCEP